MTVITNVPSSRIGCGRTLFLLLAFALPSWVLPFLNAVIAHCPLCLSGFPCPLLSRPASLKGIPQPALPVAYIFRQGQACGIADVLDDTVSTLLRTPGIEGVLAFLPVITFAYDRYSTQSTRMDRDHRDCQPYIRSAIKHKCTNLPQLCLLHMGLQALSTEAC